MDRRFGSDLERAPEEVKEDADGDEREHYEDPETELRVDPMASLGMLPWHVSLNVIAFILIGQSPESSPSRESGETCSRWALESAPGQAQGECHGGSGSSGDR